MHNLLARQLKKLGLLERDDLPYNFDEFIERVDQAYQCADADRILLENSLELSSRELRELNEELQKKSETKLA